MNINSKEKEKETQNRLLGTDLVPAVFEGLMTSAGPCLFGSLYILFYLRSLNFDRRI